MPDLTDREHIEDMAQGIEREFEGLLTQLEEQIRQKLTSEEASVDLFHDLKGASASFGFVALSRQLSDHEQSCRAKDPLGSSWRADCLQLLEQSLQEILSRRNA